MAEVEEEEEEMEKPENPSPPSPIQDVAYFSSFSPFPSPLFSPRKNTVKAKGSIEHYFPLSPYPPHADITKYYFSFSS